MNLKTLNLRRRKPLMPNLIRALCLIAVAGLIAQIAANPPRAMAEGQQQEFKAGLASTVITPDQPMWMAGYAARTKPSEGKVHDLRAKALALEDAQGARVVIVTVDLLGISRTMRDWIEKEVTRRYKLPPESLLLSASHTHCGPAVREAKYSVYGDNFYGLSQEEVQQSEKYAEDLRQKLLQLVGQAIEDLAPARLSYSHARAGFAMNRRSKVEKGYQIQPNPDGPVDHDVPVLRIDGPDGNLRAVLFGYACHCTTLDFYKFCGDYAGF
ncbi:MAG TPA: neutral/alkaline non-lysosomal ceramidase N-terminal domain-containing protein, partial [Sedimentisphaerales bacterium]|nr:neutral/alkaline non-lysosomal ceramidase N-terminal domain-containing protein [Sedimentisphaerales bacterium]